MGLLDECEWFGCCEIFDIFELLVFRLFCEDRLLLSVVLEVVIAILEDD